MKCKTCGKNADSEFCFKCKARKPLSTGKGLTSKPMGKGLFSQMRARPATDLERTREKIDREAMRLVFFTVWYKRPHKSEVSGEYLGSEVMSTYFHHILPKEKYPEACLDEENIVLLSLLEHSNVENDMYKYEEVNKRREQLKLKYERT